LLGQTFSLTELPSPILTNPTAHISEIAPTFTWSAVPLASSYGVYVLDLTTNESRTGIVFTTNTSWTPTTALVRGRSYRWWVASVSENASFIFTESWQNFTIDL
jgi:hypothetical protein